MDIGEIIKNSRKKRGLTQKQFAGIMNVHFSTISHWETNDRTPSATELIKIASVLDIVQDLFPGYKKEAVEENTPVSRKEEDWKSQINRRMEALEKEIFKQKFGDINVENGNVEIVGTKHH